MMSASSAGTSRAAMRLASFPSSDRHNPAMLPEEADNPRVHDAPRKGAGTEPEVAADRYRQQNVCHDHCVIHIPSVFG